MKITERRLRSIIRSVIKESLDGDLSSSQDLRYLSDLGIHSLEDAVSHAMQSSNSLTSESINRHMFHVIKESLDDDQKLMNSANLINNQIKDDSPEALEAAAIELSKLKQEKNSRARLKIVTTALAVLGLSAFVAPMILFVISGLSVGAAGGVAATMLSKMGTIGAVISMATGATAMQASVDMSERPHKYL